MAALAASDLPETAIKKILPSVWPGTNSAENVVAQMDVACRNADNRDETLVAVMFKITNAARGK